MPKPFSFGVTAALGLTCALAGGCVGIEEYVRNGFKVGPNYGRPPAPVAQDWIDSGDRRVRKDSDDLSRWWTVFNDPALDALVCEAYRQNLSLRQAGFQVLLARAQLGIALGNLFPQSQQATGDYLREGLSVATVNRTAAGTLNRFFGQWDFGFSLAWELDFWGRFRRAIESADANLDASVENYDDVLVTLLADTATNYVNVRTFQQRVTLAQDNVVLQQRTLDITQARFNGGSATRLDLEQARSNLAQTKALIPQLETSLRQANDQLCILLGMPPQDLTARLVTADIPQAPVDVAVGIPADLLRRRPDVRRAERQAAAQCAQIGIADSEFYPRISLDGTLGYSAEHIKQIFTPAAFQGTFGPSFSWNVLNYGRILNNVRAQSAQFQALVAGYQNVVLTAGAETEDGLVAFLKAQERVRYLTESVEAAQQAHIVGLAQYQGGTINYDRIVLLEQNLVQLQDLLAQARGDIALGLIQVYRSLGGGWQIRCNGSGESCPPLPEVLPATSTAPPATPPLPPPTKTPGPGGIVPVR